MPRLQISDVHTREHDVPQPHRIAGSFVAELICPSWPVDREGGVLFVPQLSHWMRNQTVRLAAGDPTPSALPGYDQVAYGCTEHAIGARIPPARADFSFEAAAREYGLELLALDLEERIKALLFDTDTIANEAVGVTWNLTNAAPIDDLVDALDTLEAACGVRPDSVLVPIDVARELFKHEDTRAIILAGLPAPPAQSLASFLRVSRFLVADARVTTSAEGTAEADCVFSPIWSDAYCLLAYTNAANEEFRPALARNATFRGPATRLWVGENGRIQQVDAQRIDAPTILNARLGYLLTGLLG